jgi:hypothetical protein
VIHRAWPSRVEKIHPCYRWWAKWTGVGDNTNLFWVVLSQQAPQRRRNRSLVGGELRETNPCISLWFATLSCFSSIFDLLPLRSTWVCYLCVQGSLPCLWSSTKATRQVWFVLEVKRSLKLFLQVLCGSLVWPVEGNGLSSATCWAESGTGLTSLPHWSDRWHLAVQVFRDEKFKLVVMPIHHPLGDTNFYQSLVLWFELNRLEFFDVDNSWGNVGASISIWLKLFFLITSCTQWH